VPSERAPGIEDNLATNRTAAAAPDRTGPATAGPAQTAFGPGQTAAPARDVAGPGQRTGDSGQNGGAPAAPARGWLGRLAGLIRRNLLFTVAVLLAVVPRVVAMLGYRPAILIRLDSYFYLLDATRSHPDPDNIGGYSFFLRLVRPLHSLVAIVTLQHLMGLAIAVLIYVILRRNGVPGWAGTLGALPVLFDSREILLEQAIMADTLATLLMISALAVLLTRRFPSLWRSAVAGLLMGVSGLVRPTVLPLIVLIALYLLIRRVGWRRAGAALLAGLLPVAAYVAWFYSAFGVLNLTNSSGLFLWARTTSFANCKIIKPPANMLPLCPDRNPAVPGRLRPNPYNVHTLLQQENPQNFLWTRTDWPWQPLPKGYESYDAAFTPAKNKLAQKFAIKAIKAQPLAYARVVGEGIGLTFFATDHAWPFPAIQPHSVAARSPGRHDYELQTLQTYLGSTDGLSPYLGKHLGMKLYHPESGAMVDYQKFAYLPGVLFALAFAVGLVVIVIRRRVSAAMLLWVSGVVVLVLPIAENQYNYRYALPAVPLACMAVILAVTRRAGENLPDSPALVALAPAAPSAESLAEESAAGSPGAGTPAASTPAAEPGAAQATLPGTITQAGLPIRPRPDGPPEPPARPQPSGY
jgi:hypothetical protein